MDLQAIYVAAKLGIADRLATQTVSNVAREVSELISTLQRPLHGMASVGLFTEVSRPGAVRVDPDRLLPPHRGARYLRALALTVTELDWQPWGQLLHSVRTGETAFPRVYGASVFSISRSTLTPPACSTRR